MVKKLVVNHCHASQRSTQQCANQCFWSQHGASQDLSCKVKQKQASKQGDVTHHGHRQMMLASEAPAVLAESDLSSQHSVLPAQQLEFTLMSVCPYVLSIMLGT